VFNKYFHHRYMHLLVEHKHPPAAQAGHYLQRADSRLSSRRPGASFNKDLRHQRTHRSEAHKQPAVASQAARVGYHSRQGGLPLSSQLSGAVINMLFSRSSGAELAHNCNLEPERPKFY
jgi:hypothetical protein